MLKVNLSVDNGTGTAAASDPKKGARSALYDIIRISLGAIFVWSGITKLLDPQQFAVIIEAYGILPDPWTFPTAVCLSIVEFLAGLGLIADLRWSLGTVTVLLVLFLMILGYGLMMGLDVDCGCFGPGDPEAEAYHGLRPALYRDVVMLTAALGLIVWRRINAISLRQPLPLRTLFLSKGDKKP